ncbi:MAG: TauD/TfdA family dioxygenase [Chloroflexota bacterium]
MQDQTQITVKPLSVHIGAEIEGVDLTQPLGDQAVTEIRTALLQWKVVFFRNQFLSHAQHVHFARQFGDPTPGHVVFGGDDEYPEIYSVAKHRTANQGKPSVKHSWTGWHADITAAVNPPFASILRGEIVPPYGGDTQWTNLAAAYQDLSPTMRTFLTQLRTVHSYNNPTQALDATAYNEKLNANNLITEHPLVRVHPETGEEVLYVSPNFAKSIVGLTPTESEALLVLLKEHAVRPEYTVHFKWAPGSIAFWDNRATAHLAPSDIYATDFDRQFYRVTLNGDIPVGVDGEPSRLISGRMIEAI